MGILFGAIFLITFMWLAISGLGIWLLVKAIGAVKRFLTGETKRTERIEAPKRPQFTESVSNNERSSTSRSSTARPPRDTRSNTKRDSKPVAPTNAPTPSEHTSEHGRYVHLGMDASNRDIQKIAREYVDDDVVGSYARDVLYVLDSLDRKRDALLTEIDCEFERETISWDRFVGATNAACDAIHRNCILLTNRIQTFDTYDYHRMEEFYKSGGFSSNGTQDAARLQRWKILDETKREMDSIRSANEGLLLELEKLSSELGKLSTNESTDESARIAKEVRDLAEETKYYR